MNTESSSCKACGQPLASHGRCPRCGAEEHVWTLEEWRRLLQLALILLLGYSFTRLVVNANNRQRRTLASSYCAAGVRELEQGHPVEAVRALESALIYSHGNMEYQLRLTDALLNSGATREAAAQLHSELEQSPGDAGVYLRLARLEARLHHVDDAVRYYQAASQGSWPETSDPFPQRIAARFEAAEYLVNQGRQEEAEANLLALAAVLPATWPEQSRLGALFLRNGDPVRARNVYAAALNQERDNPAALMGAARASMATADYAGAKRYLTELRPPTAEARTLLAALDRIESLDPFAPKTTASERAVRTIHLYHIANDRLIRCQLAAGSAPPADSSAGTSDAGATRAAAPAGKPSPGASPAELNALRNWSNQLAPLMVERKLRGRDALIESALRFAFQAEIVAERQCGAGSPNDEALLALAQGRMGVGP